MRSPVRAAVNGLAGSGRQRAALRLTVWTSPSSDGPAWPRVPLTLQRRRSVCRVSQPSVPSLRAQAGGGETAYLDPRTGKTYPLSTPRWSGEGQAPLLLTPLPGITRADIRTGVRSLWRYSAALPFEPEDPITMGEGCTPLVPRDIAGCRALLKCEWFMPTGSFKDRGATVMLSLLRAQGVTHVLEDSSGNGGAAVSA